MSTLSSNFILHKNFISYFFPQNITIKICDGKKYNFPQCVCVDVKRLQIFCAPLRACMPTCLPMTNVFIPTLDHPNQGCQCD